MAPRRSKSSPSRKAGTPAEQTHEGSGPLAPEEGDEPLLIDQLRPVLEKVWEMPGRGIPDLATNPDYLKGFGE